MTPFAGQRIYEDLCSDECEELFNNNVCDLECNLLQCLYDNGDCDGEDNPDQPMTGEPFYRSIDFVNLLFNRKFNLDESNGHTPSGSVLDIFPFVRRHPENGYVLTVIKAPSVDSSHAISLFKSNSEGTSCHICQRNKSYELT